jgi:DNA modification methylase
VIAEGLESLAVEIATLDALEGNPRQGDVEAVKRSYERFGQRKPLVARRRPGGRAEVTAGNTQLAAALELGWSEVAVVFTDDDDDTARAWALADNRTSDLGRYDEKALLAFLQSVSVTGDEELLAATGYTPSDVAGLVARLRQGHTDANDIPEPPATPMAQPGDVWLLGEHRLACGDATDPDVVALALDGAEPYLMVTDPPYGVELDPRWRDAIYNKMGPEAKPYMSEGHGNRTLSGDTRADWSEAFELVPSLRVAYVWHGALHAVEVAEGLRRIGFKIVSHVIWDKGAWVISRGMYHWGHEPCWVARRGGKVPFYRPKNQGTVWRAPSPKMIMTGSDEEKFDHPAQKPLAVIEPPILNHLRPLGVVYEPFCGSGTTLMAAEVHGRRCVAIEIEPRYVDVTAKRWQLFTGSKPVLASSGEPIDFDA